MPVKWWQRSFPDGKGFSRRQRPRRRGTASTTAVDPRAITRRAPKYEREQPPGKIDPHFGKECALKLTAGRDLKRPMPNTGRYTLCLSTNQARMLFPDAGYDGREVGRGSAAIVMTRGRDAVVKITRDPDDIAALQVSQDLRHVARVGRVYHLLNAGRDGNTDRWIPIYAALVERLKPPDAKKLRSWMSEEGPVGMVRAALLYEADTFQGPRSKFRLSPQLRRSLSSACNGYGQKYAHLEACKRFLSTLGHTWEELYRRGIRWADLHEGNVAETKRGEWKAIDLGISRFGKLPEAEQLQGMLRAAREMVVLYGIKPKAKPLP